jgi:hypothetical protein
MVKSGIALKIERPPVPVTESEKTGVRYDGYFSRENLDIDSGLR